ncbi:MAG: hypothetical protein JKY95_19850 [Planctomycetaceae bacterium]|nr:hypothetical protein [Planctomycetaceae bacterium]MBL4886767.1 hypothetical protein [Planctomycetaceae bacterium]
MSFNSLSMPTCAFTASSLELVQPATPSRDSSWKKQGLPSSWGASSIRLPCSRDPGRMERFSPKQNAHAAPTRSKMKAPTKVLSRLSHIASEFAAGTEHSLVGFAMQVTQNTTQDSLLAAG